MSIIIVVYWLVIWASAQSTSFGEDEADTTTPALPVPENVLDLDADPPTDSEEPENDDVGVVHGSQFISNRGIVRQFESAKKRVLENDYEVAVQLLQSILNQPYDTAIITSPDGGELKSIRRMAETMLRDLPAEGREVYELQFGLAAKTRLESAKAAGNWKEISDISRCYAVTKAGQDASFLLGLHQIDTGNYLLGALTLNKLRQEQVTRFDPVLTSRLLYAAERADLNDITDDVSALFANDSTLFGDDDNVVRSDISSQIRDLKQQIDNGTFGHNKNANEWRVPLGDDDGNSSDREPVSFAGGASWSHSIWDQDYADPISHDRFETLKNGIQIVTKNATSWGEATLPATSPLGVGDLIIIRTVEDIRAVDINTGKLRWKSAPEQSEVLDQVIKQTNLIIDDNLPPEFVRSHPVQEFLSQQLWQNLTAGTLSSDGRYVYSVQECGKVSGSTIVVGVPRNGELRRLGNESYNRLVAYDLEAEGRIAWTLEGIPTAENGTGRYFLGPPLPLGNRLYILAEQDGEICLLQLDPTTSGADRIAWTQPLVSPVQSVRNDPDRRVSGLMPSFSDGLLVCPTGAGAIVGVNIQNQSLQWGLRYDVNSHLGFPVNPFGGQEQFGSSAFSESRRNRQWFCSIPQISGDSIVVTPRDSNSLYCIDGTTGTVRWTAPRESHLYVADVTPEHVVVVGRTSVDAYDLQSGTRLWSTTLENNRHPAGRGIANNSVLYLPTSRGTICAIELKHGKLVTEVETGTDLQPGNLIVSNGRLVSASMDHVIGFPTPFPSGTKPASETTDLTLLSRRGEDRLMRGELIAGIADLKSVLAQTDNERIRRLLFITLYQCLRNDFDQFEDFGTDLVKLTTSTKEHIDAFQVLSAGYASRKNNIKAAKYLIQLDNDPKALCFHEKFADGRRVRADRIVQSDFFRVYNNATSNERDAIDRIVLDRMREHVKTNSVAKINALYDISTGTKAHEQLHSTVANVWSENQAQLKLAILNTQQHLSSITDPKDPLLVGDKTVSGRISDELVATYSANQIGVESRRSHYSPLVPIRTLGPVPEQFRTCTLQFDRTRHCIVARDEWGSDLWQVSLPNSHQATNRLSSNSNFLARFAGPLLAISIETRLVMLDIRRPSSPPTILWWRDMVSATDAAITFQLYNNERIEGVPTLASRFGFAGPKTVICKGQKEIIALDSITGDELWSIPGSDLDMEIIGDSRVVVLAPIPSRKMVYRTSDGSLVNKVERQTSETHVVSNGPLVVYWSREGQHQRLLSKHAVSDKIEWTYQYPNTALIHLLDKDQIAVLDPVTGKIDIISWSLGKIVFSGTISPEPAIQRFSVFRSGGMWLVCTEYGARDRFAHEPGRAWPVFQGVITGLNASGKTVWQSDKIQMQINQGTPSAVPLWVTVSEEHVGPQPKWKIHVFDSRSGRKLITQLSYKSAESFKYEIVRDPFEVEIQIPTGRIVIEEGAATSRRLPPYNSSIN